MSIAVHTDRPITPTRRAGLLRISTSSSLACKGARKSFLNIKRSMPKDTIAANTVGRVIILTYCMNSTPK